MLNIRMKHQSFLFLFFLCATTVVSSLDIRGQIQWNDICPNYVALRPSKVILDNGEMQGGIMRNGSFVIPNTPPGTYVLSVVSPDHSFDHLRVDVLDLGSTPEVRPYVVGTPLNPPSTISLSHPIILIPRQKHLYFIPPETFNLVAMVSNPMMLLMVFGGVMMLAMPYLMNNMDPEVMAEFKEQHAKVVGAQNALSQGDIKSGLSALIGTEEPAGNTTTQTPIKSSSNIKSRSNNKTKKR